MSEQNSLLSFASHVTDLSKDLRQTLQAALIDKRCTQSELKELLDKIEALEPIAVEFEEVIHSLSDTLKPLREAKRTLVSATAVIDPRGRGDVGIAFMRITRALERMRTLMTHIESTDYLSNEVDTDLERATFYLCAGLEYLAQDLKTPLKAKTKWVDDSQKLRNDRADYARLAVHIHEIVGVTASLGRDLMHLIGNLRLSKAIIQKLLQGGEADVHAWWQFWDRTDMDEAKRLIEEVIPETP
jgi:hypothetical protein